MNYTVRRLCIGKTDQLDGLARECGRLYSATVVCFWRTVRKQGIWLKPSSMMRWLNSDLLHAHTADATVQAFYASLKSWRKRRKQDPDAHPPRKRRYFFRVEYKNTAIRLKEGKLILSNGRGNAPLVIDWQWRMPQTLTIHWTGTEYEAIACYADADPEPVEAGRAVAVDMGEIHPAVTSDGVIANGRYLRSLRRLRNKTVAKFQAGMDTKKKRSRRWKKLRRAKARMLARLDNKIKDVLHKTTRRLVSTWQETKVQTVVIGDVRDIRKDNDCGKVQNQRLNQWHFGKVRWYLTYKAERLGMKVELQDERYTSQTCPNCQNRKKPNGRRYKCPVCGYTAHRDHVGSLNILRKYQGYVPVEALMARATGVRYHAHLRSSASNGSNRSREAAGL